METTDNYNVNVWDSNEQIDARKPERPFLDSQMLWLPDSNNSSNYSSNMIEFNTIVASNSGRVNDFANSYIELPLVFTVIGSGTTTVFDTAAGLLAVKNLLAVKCSNMSFIDSATIDVGTTSVCNANIQNMSLYSKFRQDTETNVTDSTIRGYSDGYIRDDADFNFNETGVAGTCLGLSNNGVNSATVNGNSGFNNRTQTFQIGVTPVGTAVATAKHAFLGKEILKTCGFNYYEVLNATTVVYYYTCRIPVKQLHPFFETFPLTKGCIVKLKLFTNTLFNFTVTNTAGIFSSSALNMTGGSIVNPLMISCPAQPTFATGGTMTVTSGIANVGQYKHIKTQCRWYYPSFKCTAQYDQQFMSSPEKSLLYTDLFGYSCDIAPTENFSRVISTTMPRIKRMIIAFSLKAPQNGTNSLVGSLSSPFFSGNSVPTLIQNFQVLVDNNVLFSNPITYHESENYLLNLNKYGVNTNMINGMRVGISQRDFGSIYCYYVVNLENRETSSDNINHSVSIQGTLSSLKAVTCHVFVEYDKTLTLNVISGGISV
jgi:hypothetical protein